MAYQSFKDASGTTQYRKVTGAGTTGDPAACHQIIDSGAVDASQAGTWNITNISGTISLPTGAATAAKQPALGTAGTASSDVITVQGIASMTALKVDGSAVTQPVSLTSTTITGTVAATQSGTWTVTGSGGTFPVTDSGGSLTVDAPVGTPVYVRLSDGAAAISTLPVSLASLPSLASGTNGIGKLTSNSGVTIGAVEIAATQTLSTVTTVSTLTGGGVAHDGVDSGNPVKVGAIATASLLGRTPVAAADRTDLVADTAGAVIVRSGTSLEDIISEVKTNTDGASTAMTSAFAATASQRIYLTDIIIANSSATNITVDIRDGSAGSVLATFPVPAGGGVVHSFATPLRFSTNTAAAFDGSAAATTLSVTMIGFKAKF